MSQEDLCTLCNWDVRRRDLQFGSRVVLCSACVDVNLVRTFCYKCKVRLDLSLAAARELFRNHLGGTVAVERTGTVVFFPDGCPQCAPGEERTNVRCFGIEPQYLH